MQFGHLNRRDFIYLIAGTTAWPFAARAQQAGGLARVGVLGPNLNNPIARPSYKVFLSELRKLGFNRKPECCCGISPHRRGAAPGVHRGQRDGRGKGGRARRDRL
jgi:hypothetical protein